MNTRHFTGFLHDLWEPRHLSVASLRLTGPTVAGRAFRGQRPQELTVMAHASRSPRLAEQLRLALIDGAGRCKGQGWSLAAPVVAMEPPMMLAAQPFTMLRWTTRGPAREQHWTGAWLRSGQVTWEVLAMDDHDSRMESVVGQVAVDLHTRDTQSTGALWDLLPVAADLPVPMHLDASLGDDPLDALATAA